MLTLKHLNKKYFNLYIPPYSVGNPNTHQCTSAWEPERESDQFSFKVSAGPEPGRCCVSSTPIGFNGSWRLLGPSTKPDEVNGKTLIDFMDFGSSPCHFKEGAQNFAALGPQAEEHANSKNTPVRSKLDLGGERKSLQFSYSLWSHTNKKCYNRDWERKNENTLKYTYVKYFA